MVGYRESLRATYYLEKIFISLLYGLGPFFGDSLTLTGHRIIANFGAGSVTPVFSERKEELLDAPIKSSV